MTTATQTLTTIRIPDGCAPCSACGRAVEIDQHRPDPYRLVLHPEGRALADGTPANRGDRGALAARFDVTFTRCSDCARTVDVAGVLLARFPSWVRAVGSVGVDRLVAALDGLAAVGAAMGSARATHLSRPALLALVHRVGPAGASVTWASRYANRMPVGGELATVGPWAHLDAEQHANLRAATAMWMQDRASLRRGPQTVLAPPAPDDNGRGVEAGARDACLLCGVGSTSVPPLASTESAWAPVVAYAHQFGMRGGHWVRGSLCAPCSAAMSAAGSLGPSAWTRSLITALGLQEATRDLPDVRGLVPHAATGRGAEVEPWAHVDRDQIRAVLADVTKPVA